MELLPSFEQVLSLGVYAWDASRAGCELKDFEDVQADEVLKALTLEGAAPHRLIDVQQLRLPLTFREDLKSKPTLNKFPNDPGYVVPLFAAKQRGQDLSKIDFLLGGSSLNVLASQGIERGPGDEELRYVAQKVPGTELVVLCKSHFYHSDSSGVGAQFERLLTGYDLAADRTGPVVEALQLMRLGSFTVLFSAEVDAADAHGELVEIKSGNPRYFGMKVMFQMISSGAKRLVYADKRGKRLEAVRTKSLAEMVREHPAERLRQAEANILAALHQLKGPEATALLDSGPVELSYSRGQLQLLPSERRVLPRQEVVAELLAL